MVSISTRSVRRPVDRTVLLIYCSFIWSLHRLRLLGTAAHVTHCIDTMQHAHLPRGLSPPIPDILPHTAQSPIHPPPPYANSPPPPRSVVPSTIHINTRIISTLGPSPHPSVHFSKASSTQQSTCNLLRMYFRRCHIPSLNTTFHHCVESFPSRSNIININHVCKCVRM